MGPSKSRGTDSPLFTSKSSPSPMSCNILPTRPPPTITAGTTLPLALTASMVKAAEGALKEQETFVLYWNCPIVRILEMGFEMYNDALERGDRVLTLAMDVHGDMILSTQNCR
uniref:Uncharacterized protein n=1 Tax=Opuntia streptacantha TaxID=393608 RepID=A0A7C9ALY7_OPUST